MIETLLLTLTPLPSLAAPAAPTTLVVQDEQAQDHEQAIAAAGEDVAKLVELAEAWSAAENDEAARAAYKRILEIDANHEAAHKALGHHSYDGQWFETYAALSKYRREEAKRMAEQGLQRFGDDWVPIADVPFLRMGWSRAEDGAWLKPGEEEKRALEAKYRDEGWKQQTDLVWVSPDEVGNWDKGLWKVGDQWLSTEEANAHHAQLDQWWTWPGQYFVVLTTCTNEEARWAAWWADQTYPELVRLFGLKPEGRPELCVVNGIPQYNVMAGGDPASGRQPNEGTGWSSVHYAYFADAWVDASTTPPGFNGMGVCYWDTQDEGLKVYGQHAIRHAAALSYIDEIDPSWDFISRAVSGGGAQGGTGGFWSEKKIPLWLRYGAASYVERFFKDGTVDAAANNVWWARDWALENLRAAGDLHPFEQIFAFTLDPNDPATSGKLIAEAGLVVSFILDGNCAPVVEAHQGFKAALRSGEGVAEALDTLQKEIVRNERKFRMFANL